MLPGDTCETLEGIPEASISYRLKARVARSRLASDIQTYKHVRVIRTLEPSALEFLHAMSVENIWPNKVEYSIVVPQKAVVFGGTLPIEMRLTPLLKGLELGDIQARLLEIRECDVSREGSRSKEYRTEREAGRWKFNATEMNWHDTIEETGQEGWVIEKKLDLPKRLRQCVQDITQHGVKIRHKVKLTIGLKNPDGHISEVRYSSHLSSPQDHSTNKRNSSARPSPYQSSSPPTSPSTKKATSPLRPAPRTSSPPPSRSPRPPATAPTSSTSSTPTSASPASRPRRRSPAPPAPTTTPRRWGPRRTCPSRRRQTRRRPRP